MAGDTTYRYPGEHFVLFLTITVVMLVIALTATATLCASVLFVTLALLISFYTSRSAHRHLVENAQRVTPNSGPEIYPLIQTCKQRIRPGEVDVFVTPSRQLNAYTFGLSEPKAVVLYSSLFNVMDQDELSFILGHELGHIQLGHTWLNSLIGGMAGIPSPSSASALLMLAFLWWNRMCEYSADRAGLLACRKPEKAISALIKLVAGQRSLTREGMELAYRKIDAEDDTWMGSLSEALGSHPMIIRRIQHIREYAASNQYRQLFR
ncbi:MAG: M48 family metallopeptidase [Anaerolineales bacterium]|nr:M48 family metallopeptidase [Anaerolineales bacterium]